jgi:hypothetical protein
MRLGGCTISEGYAPIRANPGWPPHKREAGLRFQRQARSDLEGLVQD